MYMYSVYSDWRGRSQSAPTIQTLGATRAGFLPMAVSRSRRQASRGIRLYTTPRLRCAYLCTTLHMLIPHVSNKDITKYKLKQYILHVSMYLACFMHNHPVSHAYLAPDLSRKIPYTYLLPLTLSQVDTLTDTTHV